MNDEHEVLVHISASVTRKNDQLYRSLTAAYLDFEPYQPSISQNQSYLTASQASNQQADVSNATTSKESYGSFPSHILSEGPASTGPDPEIENSPGSLQEKSDISTGRLGQLDRIQSKWRDTNGAGPSLLRRKAVQDEPRTSRTIVKNRPTFIEDTQLAAQVIESQLLDYCSTTSEETSASAKKIDESESHPAVEIENEEQVQDHTFGTPDAAPLTPEVPLQPAAEPEPPATTHSQVGSGFEDTTEPIFSFKFPSLTFPIDFTTLPTIVSPPPPKISILAPGTLPSQITPHLSALKRQNPTRYRPRKTSRPLDTDERGHWLVDTSTWANSIQYDFWVSVAEDVREGRLGWGITLHREVTRQEQLQRQGLGVVRVYCWGEVVEHVWLALWLCSRGEIAAEGGEGARWVDAGDEVVVELL